MINGMFTSDLSRIFREALQVIHHCKLEYLWIDSLCINQDDIKGRKPDWEKEAVKIGDIYTGGVFNMAAIGSSNSDGTLFPEQKEFFAPVVRDCFSPRGGYNECRPVGILADSDADFERQVMSSELLSRGWVYQEVMLAPANLFCTSQQMWWLCHAGRYCQDQTITTQEGPQRVRIPVPTGATLSKGREAIANPEGKSGSLETWGNLLRLYTKTSVTFEDDRLAAIAGLSKVFRSVFPGCVESASYSSGFWSEDVVFQLSWHRPPSATPIRRAAGRFIPSWSPVSCRGEIIYPENDEPSKLPITWTMDASGLDSFGRAQSIKQRKLHLRGVPVDVNLGMRGVEYQVWPPNLPGLGLYIQWDSQTEMALADEGLLKDGLRALILIAAEVRESVNLEGILLRRCRDDDLAPDKPPDKSSNESPVESPDKWIRCGYLMRSSFHIGKTFEAFQLTRYGITWVEDERGHVKRVSTGAAPNLNLEDICLV